MMRPQNKHTFHLIPLVGLVVFLLTIHSLLFAQSPSNPEPAVEERMLDAGGHRLSTRVTGAGTPLVVIEVGFGGAREEWSAIIREIGVVTAILDFDRAGYGESEVGPMPRTPSQAASELRSALQEASNKPPYLLVGHSLGALNALVFCALYPELVAGLVLLDPPPKDFIRGLRFADLVDMADEQTRELEGASRNARGQGDEVQADYLETLASEHEMMFDDGARMIESISNLGDVPLVVIGSDVPNPAFGASAAEFQKFWIESNRELASLSTEGKFVLAHGSTHRIHEDAQSLVVSVIRELLEDHAANPRNTVNE